MAELVADLLSYIDRSPTPYHAVAESVRRLEAGGYRRIAETELWNLESGSRHYVIRNEGSLLAFEVGMTSPCEAGFRIVGAHTDSPNLRLKPTPDVVAYGYRQLAVEVYGGALLHTWTDRDLSLAGRVVARQDGRVRTLLLDFGRPLLRVPNLAIHLDRAIHTDGLKLNPQTQMAPIVGLGDAPSLEELVVTELRAQRIADLEPGDLLSCDLMAYDSQLSGVSGARGEFIHAPRLDNLASCHAGLTALLRAGNGDVPQHTRVVALYDHEEVGSRSAGGAAGPLLEESLERIVAGFKGGQAQGLARAVASSRLVSADMAHAVHPNFADRHEPSHHPVIGSGPVIKQNVNQAYATDAVTLGSFASLCAEVGVKPQYFVSRNDQSCGSTIGPISASRVGIRTVDVGNPMLSMHSCREMAGTADVEPMVDVLRAFFDSAAA